MMKKSEISELIRPNILSLKSYGAKETRCKIKLDANESPVSPLPVDKLAGSDKLLRTLNRYPDPEGRALKNEISKKFGVSFENIALGNGSDEIIYYLITTIGGPVLFPTPTFVMYDIIARGIGEKALSIPLDEKFDLDIDAMISCVEREKPKIIFLSSPNNPTGSCFSRDRIIDILKISKAVVVVDEAYLPFADNEGFVPFLKKFPNLVVMKTLSKIGFAAIRVGFMIADKAIVSQVEKIRLPYNINSLSQHIATLALKNSKLIKALTREIKSERKRVMEEMLKIDGVEPFPSDANFIMFKVKYPDVVFNGLLRRGILIKNLNNIIPNAMRVTIGTKKENNLFISALKKVSGASKREDI